MKKSIQTLLAITAFGALSLAARGETAVKLLVIDLAKVYDTHYETEEQNAKIRSDDQKAQDEVNKMNKEGNALVESYKGLEEQGKNPALTADAKAKAQAEAQKIMEQIQLKQRDVQTFIQNTQRSLQSRLQNFRSVMLEKLSKIAADIAKRKGATLLLDKAGPTLIGVSNVIYSDASFDITDEVIKEVNKDRPAGSVAAPAATPAAAAPASGDTPKITFPGAK